MRLIGVIEADLERSGIGTRSRLAEELSGEPVLRRTVARVLGAKAIGRLHVVTRPEQRGRISHLLEGLGVSIETHDAPPPVWRNRVAAGRKWALDGWRGGVGGACALDEGFHPAVAGALAQRESAGGVAWVPAGAVVIDPVLIDRMVEHFVGHAAKAKMVFAQTPPGLSPVIWEASVLRNLGGMADPPGRLLAYLPDEPAHDIVVSDCGYKVPAEVTHTVGRFLADTRRGMERLGRLLREAGGDSGGLTVESVCRWQRARRFNEAGSLPREVEIELTTMDQLAGSALRPRGAVAGERGPIRPEIVERVLAEPVGYDDSLVVLGGFGEPLLHPELEGILRICRPRSPGNGGVYGLAVRTNAIAMTRERIERLLGAGVDVISVMLDATTAATYRAAHGADHFETARANVETLLAIREQAGAGVPLVVPEMVKVSETFGEMEAFFDEWTRRVGWANIEPFNCGAGRRADRSVMPMAPPSRSVCGRLWSRCLVLADGRVARCDQDYAGAEPVGDIARQSLSDIWAGAELTRIRGAHRKGDWPAAGLCAGCQEWHRP